MKKIFFAIAALMTFAACDDKNDPTPLPADPDPVLPAICGEWESLKIDNEAKVYLSFGAEGSFELYQHMTGDGYDLYNGDWTISEDGGILSGTYNDEEPWAYSYEFVRCPDVINIDSPVDTLKLKATETGSVENVFVSCTIPEVVKESANVIVAKGAYDDRSPVL